MPKDPTAQHAAFREAVEALGGIRATARQLDMTERHAGRLYSGASPLHDGILQDISQALLRHADLCRQLERQLSPAFASNLTERQLGPADRRGRDRRGARVRVKDPAALCAECGRTVAVGHRQGCPNTDAPWPTIEAEVADNG